MAWRWSVLGAARYSAGLIDATHVTPSTRRRDAANAIDVDRKAGRRAARDLLVLLVVQPLRLGLDVAHVCFEDMTEVARNVYSIYWGS